MSNQDENKKSTEKKSDEVNVRDLQPQKDAKGGGKGLASKANAIGSGGGAGGSGTPNKHGH